MLEMSKELKFECNLKKIMLNLDLSASELHRRTGIALTTIRSMTNGGTLDRIDRGSTEKILRNLNCTFEELWAVQWQGEDE
jgi:DNA-binding Xre family transcriptional regulator